MADAIAKPRSGIRRVLRAVRRLVVGLLAFAIVAVGVTLIVIHTDWGRGKIKNQIESAMQDAFPGGATIGSLEGSVLRTFTLRDVTIKSLDGKPAITIKQIDANLALSQLFSKTAEVESLAIDGIKIVIGAAPLTKPSKPPDPEPASWSVQLPVIAVANGSLEVIGERPISIDGLSFGAEVRIPAGKPILVEVEDGVGTWREKQLPIKLRARVVVGKTIEIRRGNFSVGTMQIDTDELIVDPDQPTGSVRLVATSAAIAAVAPEIDLPGDVKLTVTLDSAPAGMSGMQLLVGGTVGQLQVHGSIQGDPTARTAAGFLSLGDIDLTRLGIKGLPEGRGDIAVALQADRKGIRGILGTHGTALDMPRADATILFDSNWREATVTVLATGEGDLRFAAAAQGKREGKAITIERGQIVAFARDFAKPTAGRVKVTSRGEMRLDVKLDKPATILPTLDVAFSGVARASRLEYDDMRVALVDAGFRGTAVNDKVLGRVRADVRGASQAGTAIGSAIVDAEYLADGRIWSRIDAKPAAAPIGVRVTSYTTLGDIVKIALTDHTIVPASGTPWVGKGGTIAIDTTKLQTDVTVTGFVTGNGTGRATIGAKLAGGGLEATVDATQIPVAAIDPKLKGTVSGKIAVKKRGIRWDGGGDLVATDLVFDPTMPVFNGDVHVAIAGRTVTLDAKARNPDLGAARFELAVEGPRDITDVVAWRKLERTAIRKATFTVDKVKLATVSPTTGGGIDGKLEIGPTEVAGSIEVKGVRTPLGNAEGIVTFAPIGGDLYASWNANLSDVGEANVGLRVVIPARPFDPAQWKQLGRGIVKSLTASFDDVAIDPTKLAKLGIDVPYSGRLDVALAVGAGASTAQLDIKVRSLIGGALVKPVNIHVEAQTDSTGTVANSCVARAPAADPKAAKGAKPPDDACAKKGLTAVAVVPRLLEVVDLETPVTFATWVSAPQTALASALSGQVVIPKQSAPDYLALFGRADFDPKRGTADGTIVIGGTLARPTAHGEITARDLQLLSSVVGRPIPVLDELKVTSKWDGSSGVIEISAKESNGGRLHVDVKGRPDRLADARGEFRATKLDLAPLAAFLPGELAASSGMLNGSIKATGLDPASYKINVNIQLTQGQVPIHPIAGTLRNATMDVVMNDKGITLDARGLLNSCRDPNNTRCTENIRLTASAPTDVSKIDATLIATHVSTLGEIEPIINGTAKVELRRNGRLLTGDIFVRNGRIRVPVSTGDDLLDFETPDDLFYVEKPPKRIRFGQARVPTKAWLDARLHIASTQIDIEEYGVKGAVIAREPLTLRVGDVVGLDGKIAIEYGNADDIFGRRYEIEPNEIVSFDGTIDPTVDLRLSHAFPDLVLTVNVRGRPSDNDFPRMSFRADPPGRYTESDLFGFFLGGDPGGAAGSQAGDAAKGVGVSVVSQKISKRLKKLLPEKLKIDVITCEPGSATGGGSCTLGKRILNNRGYVAWKHRLTPLPNENAEEALIQYYFAKKWFFEGTGGSANIIGADVLWRHRW